ncbi:MAG: hypothetical protein IKT11_08030, partial [Bacteroidales bacterium]|nr:hypothetical protein [Bacteroidales bacterium]
VPIHKDEKADMKTILPEELKRKVCEYNYRKEGLTIKIKVNALISPQVAKILLTCSGKSRVYEHSEKTADGGAATDGGGLPDGDSSGAAGVHPHNNDL